MKIKNWEHFQHYKHRNPPWIRLYRELLNDREWFELDGETAKTLINLWLIAAEAEGELPSIQDIAFRLRTTEKQIEKWLLKLSHWLEQDARTLLAPCKQLATPDAEAETDSTETDTEAETLSEKISDPSIKIGNSRKRISYSTEFQSFWTDYPTDPLQSKKEAFTAWKRLSPDDRTQAARAAPAFRRYCVDNPDYRPVHACRFLSQRRFEGFTAANERGPPPGLSPEESAKWVRDQMEAERVEQGTDTEIGNVLERSERFRAAQ